MKHRLKYIRAIFFFHKDKILYQSDQQRKKNIKNLQQKSQRKFFKFESSKLTLNFVVNYNQHLSVKV